MLHCILGSSKHSKFKKNRAVWQVCQPSLLLGSTLVFPGLPNSPRFFSGFYNSFPQTAALETQFLLLAARWGQINLFFTGTSFHGSCCFMSTVTTWFSVLMLLFHVFCGSRPDGSRVIPSRPHGAPLRVGSPTFRCIFLAFGSAGSSRTNTFTFVSRSNWCNLQIPTSRLYLFFALPTCISGAFTPCSASAATAIT